MVHDNLVSYIFLRGTPHWLAHLGVRRSAEWETTGSNPGWTITHLKITEEN